jgi:hypothetical protein
MFITTMPQLSTSCFCWSVSLFLFMVTITYCYMMSMTLDRFCNRQQRCLGVLQSRFCVLFLCAPCVCRCLLFVWHFSGVTKGHHNECSVKCFRKKKTHLMMALWKPKYVVYIWTIWPSETIIIIAAQKTVWNILLCLSVKLDFINLC